MISAMRSVRFALLSAIACGTFACATVASAHVAGQTFELISGGYMLEIGVDKEDILPNQPVLLATALIEGYEDPAWRYAAYDAVSVQISSGDEVVFDESFPPSELAQRYLVYSFPRGGLYDVRVSYERNGAVIADGTIQLIASRYVSLEFLDWFVVALLLLGVYIGLLFSVHITTPGRSPLRR